MRIVNNCTLLLVFFEIFFLSDLSAIATSYRRVWRLLYIVPTTEPSSPLCYDDVELSRWYIYKKKIDTFSVRRRMPKWNSFIYEMTIRNKVNVLKQRWWVFFIGSIRIHYPPSYFHDLVVTVFINTSMDWCYVNHILLHPVKYVRDVRTASH